MEKFLFWLDVGGLTSWSILLSGIILAIVSIERLYFLYFNYSFDADSILETIRSQVLKREYTAALQICNRNIQSPHLNVVKTGLLSVENGREAMKSAIGASILEVSKKCEKRIPIIALIAAASTLLGLLGTISGLIQTFSALGVADASQKATLLGSGISEAMYSTGAGLTVGIIAMVVHTVCTTKADEIVGSSQTTAYKLVTWIEESERSRTNG